MKRMFVVLGLVAAVATGCSSRSAGNATQEARKTAAKEAAAKDEAAKQATAKESAAKEPAANSNSKTAEKQPTTNADTKKTDTTENQVAVATDARPSDATNGAPDAAGPPQLELGYTGDMAPADAQKLANKLNRPDDWNQWGGSPLRNSVVSAKAPTEWEIGQFDADTGAWVKEGSKNIKWVALLGSQTYGNLVVANGTVSVGTNNGAAYLKRFPADIDLGVLLCLDEKDGRFIWQDSSEKLHTGRVHDWPLMGICSSPLVEGERLYYVTSRGEVKCLDTRGFTDDENDGSFKGEKVAEKDEADVIWVLDMMSALEVSQHNMANCSITSSGDYLFVLTSNGVDDAHINLPSPNAPSFIAVDKRNGKVLWTDNSPGPNVLHGQWSSPAYAVIGDVPQVIMPGGDGWLYGFDARGEDGKSKLLWKFDCNPKESKYTLGGRADRNHLIATPVIHNNRVFVGVGEDPEHGEGIGHLWCVDPTKRGDVSPELVYNTRDPETPIPHKRNQALVKSEGDFSRPNPNSAAIWHYANNDKNGDGKFDFEETMHRTCGTVAIKDDLVVIADFSGLVHCLDANTGKPHWTHDMLAASWGSPLIAGDHVYIGDEDGDVSIIKLANELDVVGEINMGSAVYSTPIVSNGVLYITSKSYLFAISDAAAVE